MSKNGKKVVTGKEQKNSENKELKKNKVKLKIEHILTHLNISFKNKSQEEYWNLMDKKEILLCSGPAGTGKSYISILKALSLLQNKENKFEKIILIKPVVEADEKLGYLPGNVEEKLDPYIFSSMYLFEKIIGKEKTELLRRNGYIEFMAFAYLRGVNIDSSIVIAEEIQNATPRQVKTFLTRIGENSKFICNGDYEQSDRYKSFKDTGLYIAINKLKNIEDIGIYEFDKKDIIRNPIISKILDKFNGDV